MCKSDLTVNIKDIILAVDKSNGKVTNIVKLKIFILYILFYQAKYLAQIIVMGTQVVGKAFARAVRQEFAASQQAAQNASKSRHGTRKAAAADTVSGMTLQVVS